MDLAEGEPPGRRKGHLENVATSPAGPCGPEAPAQPGLAPGKGRHSNCGTAGDQRWNVWAGCACEHCKSNHRALEAGKTQWERRVGPAVPARERPWMALLKACLLQPGCVTNCALTPSGSCFVHTCGLPRASC